MSPASHILNAAIVALVTSAGAVADELHADPPNQCEACAGWNQSRAPFRIWGDTYFVGTQGLSSVLITAAQGHILIDGGLPQSAPLIAANIETLGFKLSDVKLILNSHTHYDHAGGIAALQRASAAGVAASPKARQALERGGPTEDDPQFDFGPEHNDYGAVRNVRAIRDGEVLKVGALAVTAHFTPGHTPGGTSWTWRSCDGEDCLGIAYLDSLFPVSAPGFRFSGDRQHASRVKIFRRSIERVAALDCDIGISAHPDLVDLDESLAAARRAGEDHLPRQPGICREYAEGARRRLDQRLTEEAATP